MIFLYEKITAYSSSNHDPLWVYKFHAFGGNVGYVTLFFPTPVIKGLFVSLYLHGILLFWILLEWSFHMRESLPTSRVIKIHCGYTNFMLLIQLRGITQ